jgi:mannose-6-phosphate isomerase-like protein (cupin superfamily)
MRSLRPIVPSSRSIVFAVVAVALALGWLSRELAFARERAQAAEVKSITVPLADVKMSDYSYGGKVVGKVGIYLDGDTPASRKFVTGRLKLDAGESPHPPHTHPEEEVMIIESGRGEIVCDGKTTKVGPGSVMYSTPNVPHGITNTGSEPILFYFIKWESAASK